jgi:hypothetical protein
VYIPSHGNIFTEPLRSIDRGYTYRHTDWWEGFVKYATEMASGAMICIPSFIKIGFGIHKLIGGDHISLLRKIG